MSLENEILEWRKQLVERLLLEGIKSDYLEEQMKAAEMAVYGNQVVTVNIECPLKYSQELKTILHDFSLKNGCYVLAKT